MFFVDKGLRDTPGVVVRQEKRVCIDAGTHGRGTAFEDNRTEEPLWEGVRQTGGGSDPGEQPPGEGAP
jgi:hypothetical protein